MTQIKLRRGTAAQWTTANPILSSGEAGLETDTGQMKFGNGANTWAQLPYFIPNHVHDAAAITSGTLNYARLPLVTGGTAGAIPAADYAKLQGVHMEELYAPFSGAPPSTYPYGLSYWSVDNDTSYPFAYGTVMCLRASISGNPRGFQMLIPKDSPITNTTNGQTWIRVEHDSDQWTPWFQTGFDSDSKPCAFLNSWANFNAASYQAFKTARAGADTISLVGMIKPGTLTDGVAVGTVPTVHRPNRDAYGIVIARTTVPSNVACMVAIRGTGNANPGRIELFGAPATTSYVGFGITYHLDGG